jgi:hypothetical protein
MGSWLLFAGFWFLLVRHLDPRVLNNLGFGFQISGFSYRFQVIGSAFLGF